MWTLSLKDAKLKFGRQGLLGKMALIYHKQPKSLHAHLPEMPPDKIVRDSYGIKGFVSATHLFVAKKSPYGDIVSVDKAYWDRCKETKRRIVIYVDSSGAFYEFDPSAITETQENLRGDIPMTNFSIRHGLNIIKQARLKVGLKQPKAEAAAETARENLRWFAEHKCTCQAPNVCTKHV